MIWSRVRRGAVAFGLILSVGTSGSVAQADGGALHELWRAASGDVFASWELRGLEVVDEGLALGAGGEPGPVESDTGRPFARGGLAISPPRQTSEPFRDLIPSWNATTPPGTWVEIRLRARVEDRWTRWYGLGVWSEEGGSFPRHSVRGQDDADGRVLTDTLSLSSPASAFQVSIGLFSDHVDASPRVARVAVLASRPIPTPGTIDSDRSAWGTTLDVPQRSQMVYPGGGEAWCSPTSTSMVMAYWAERLGRPELDRPVPEAAEGTFDPVYRGTGNWPFNTAYAARFGLVGYVTRFSSAVQLERWIGAGAPVAASIAWNPGELSNAPVGSTNGHLLVVVGFTSTGDVVVNDPAADPRRGQPVRRVYERGQFERLWLRSSGGTVYLIYPVGFSVPKQDAFGAW